VAHVNLFIHSSINWQVLDLSYVLVRTQQRCWCVHVYASVACCGAVKYPWGWPAQVHVEVPNISSMCIPSDRLPT
jgi:hypothetical protein